MSYLTGKILSNSSFQARNEKRLAKEIPARLSLCTTFAPKTPRRGKLSLAGASQDWTHGSGVISCTFSQDMQLPLHLGSRSSHVLQRGHVIPVDCPEGGASGHLQLGQDIVIVILECANLLLQHRLQNYWSQRAVTSINLARSRPIAISS